MTLGALPVQNASQSIPLAGSAAEGAFGIWAPGAAGVLEGPAGPAGAGPGAGAGVAAGAGAGAAGGMRPMNSGGATSRATAWLPAERWSIDTCAGPKPDGSPARPEENARTDAAIGAENAPTGPAPVADGAAATGAAASSCSSCGFGSGMEPEERT